MGESRSGRFSKNSKKDEAPKDAYYMVSILFFFLGIVHILPWSFFVTANEYWMYKFRNTSIEDSGSEFRTKLQTEFSAVLMITLTISDVSFLFVCMFFGHKFKVWPRIVASLVVILLLIAFSAIFVDIDTDSWQTAFFVITMLIVAGVNAMNSIFGMTMYTIISNFPEDYLAPYLNGQDLAGIFTALLQLLSLAAGISTLSDALLYFCLGVFVIAVTLILMIATRGNEFYAYHMREFNEGQKEKVITIKQTREILKKMWPSLAVMAFWILTVVPVHSSITSLVVSENEGKGTWNDVYFVPTCTFLLSAVADLIGRTLAANFKINLSGIWLTAFSALRMVIFVPLLMMCNAQPRENLPVWFPHDYQYAIIITAFAVSNGYLMSLCSFIVPKLVLPEELNNAYQVYMVGSGILLGVLSPIGIFSVKLL